MHPVYEKLKLVPGLQPISILVPRIWVDVPPHPSNGQNMSKTKPFRRQKRRFPDGARLQEFWFRAVPVEAWSTFKDPTQGLHILGFAVGQRLFT